MDERQRRPRKARAAVAALVIFLVALSPTLLFGSAGPFGVIASAALMLGIGLLLRVAGRGEARTLGSMLVVIGAVVLALGIGVLVLALGGWGRPY